MMMSTVGRNWGGSAPTEPKPQCKGSCVQPHHEIQINGHNHAGVITHVCSREEHEDTSCVCVCSHRFTRPFKTVRP